MAQSKFSPLGGEDSNTRIIEYVLKNGEDLSFAKAFWKECEPHPYELRRYPLYVKVLRLFNGGKSVSEITRATGVNQQSVWSWTTFRQKPKMAHYLAIFLQHGVPRPGRVWLSVNNTPGHAIPLGPVVEVPESISGWNDVSEVLEWLKPLERLDSSLSREYLFGFLVGMVIGDAAKSRERTWHRHIGLVLSKKYRTNKKIGEFTCACARSVGLRMHDVSDQPKKMGKPHGFYEWVSQASPLVDWIFNVLLGLEDNQRTTYDPVRMDWVPACPVDFRRGLVQGIAESDGSVSIASQTVEFWIGPNWDFFKQLLLTFGVKSFRNREALSVTKSQVVKLGAIPAFSPHLRTKRYLRLVKLVSARHIGHGKRIPNEIRNFLMENCAEASVPRLSEMVLDRFGIALSFEAVQRWRGRGESLDNANRAAIDPE